jgi:tetratricopeptide (TPR) repeat protein
VQQLDPQTQAAIARILSDAPPLQATQTSIVILPEDKRTLAAGESASLQTILREYLAAGDYRGAETELQGFLNLRRTAYTEARVRFYLAQAYYFQGLYEEALLEFVLAQDELYAPVQPWLESCFRHLWNKS